MSDQGLFGPDSIAWRVIGHPVAMVGGLRSLLIQSLHPLAMAGVANHSDYQRRPLDRLRGTARYVAATTFGSTAQAHAAAERVRKVHARVRGIDVVTGRPYSADDPDTQLWVHCVEWHSFLAAHRAFSREQLTRAQEDRYIAEGVRVATLLGVPASMVPTSVASMRAYFASVRPQLCLTQAAREAIDFVLAPPVRPTLDNLPYQLPMRLFARAAVATVPKSLRRLAGIEVRASDLAAFAAVMSSPYAMRIPFFRFAPALIVGKETAELGMRAMRLRAA
ncbi:MAG: oxygenase MpaB family protein [Polyangiales bacterium]